LLRITYSLCISTSHHSRGHTHTQQASAFARLYVCVIYCLQLKHLMRHVLMLSPNATLLLLYPHSTPNAFITNNSDSTSTNKTLHISLTPLHTSLRPLALLSVYIYVPHSLSLLHTHKYIQIDKNVACAYCFILSGLLSPLIVTAYLTQPSLTHSHSQSHSWTLCIH